MRRFAQADEDEPERLQRLARLDGCGRGRSSCHRAVHVVGHRTDRGVQPWCWQRHGDLEPVGDPFGARERRPRADTIGL